jgi:hypothetical protein
MLIHARYGKAVAIGKRFNWENLQLNNVLYMTFLCWIVNMVINFSFAITVHVFDWMEIKKVNIKSKTAKG